MVAAAVGDEAVEWAVGWVGGHVGEGLGEGEFEVEGGFFGFDQDDPKLFLEDEGVDAASEDFVVVAEGHDFDADFGAELVGGLVESGEFEEG